MVISNNWKHNIHESLDFSLKFSRTDDDFTRADNWLIIQPEISMSVWAGLYPRISCVPHVVP